MTEKLSEKQDVHPIDLRGQGLCWFCGSGYSFITDLLRRGLIRPLTSDDVPPLPVKLQSRNSFARINLPEHRSPGILFRTLLRDFRPDLVVIAGIGVMFLVNKLSTPLAFWWLLEALKQKPEDGGLPWWHIWAAALLLPLLGWGIAVTVAAAQYYGVMLGVALRQALSALVLQALLGVPAFNDNLGAAASALTIDTERVYMCCMEIHFGFFSMGMLIGGSAILFAQVRLAALPVILMLFLMQYAQTFFAKRIGLARKRMSVWSERRLGLSTQLIQGIRPIRMNGWDPSLRQQIQDLRTLELSGLRKVQAWKAANITFSTVGTPICLLVLLVFHGLLAGFEEVTPELFFVALSVVNPCIKSALDILPRMLGLIVEAKVSLLRIEELVLQCRKHPRDCLESLPPLQDSPRIPGEEASPIISMEEASFAWPGTKEDAFKLQKLHLHVRRGQLICILGKVGSGKSALVAAMLGELEQKSGIAKAARARPHNLPSCSDAKVDDEASYIGPFLAAHCSQQPWLQSVTVRDNVLLAGLAQRKFDGQAINQSNYEKAISVAQLLPDIENWPAGDRAEVGERGITLSGGQKARVSIARATYAVLEGIAQLVFLDDVLAALDGVVAQTVVENCILDAMAGVARVVVLSSPHALLRHADVVYCLDEGHLREMRQQELEIPDPVDTQAAAKAPSTLKESVAGEGDDAKASSGDVATGKLYQAEKRALGSLKFQALTQYFGWSGGGRQASLYRTFKVLTLFAITELAKLAFECWLMFWTNVVSKRADEPSGFLGTIVDKPGGGIAMAAGLCLLVGACAALRSNVFLHWALRCSRHIYTGALQAVSSASLTEFFDLTPSGRLVTTFSRDSDILDSVLPDIMNICLVIFVDLLVSLLVCGVTTPTYLVLVPYLLYYSVRTRVLFGTSARELKRLDGITRGPVLAHVMETIQGLVPIRAIGIEKYFWQQFLELLDNNAKYLFHLGMLTPWMMLRLNLVANIFILGVSISAAAFRNVISSSAIGLGIAYSLNIMGKLQTLTKFTVELEQMLTSAERLDDLRDAPPEAAAIGGEPADQWLHTGYLEVTCLNVRYRKGLPLVLKDVSFAVPGGTKLGVVGRSGCGKSTLMQSLLRLVEPESGCIKIDGTDIQTLSGKALRRQVAVIPQDPYLWRGTLRINLDPLSEYSEAAMLNALEVCKIKDRFATLVEQEDGNPLLDAGIDDAGTNLSVGERQLLCLCRAILKQSPVCLLDEATANIDAATEAKIQNVLAVALSAATVVVVAHRLQTVRGSDMVLRLDAGEVADFGPPETVLQAKEVNRGAKLRVSALGLEEEDCDEAYQNAIESI